MPIVFGIAYLVTLGVSNVANPGLSAWLKNSIFLNKIDRNIFCEYGENAVLTVPDIAPKTGRLHHKGRLLFKLLKDPKNQADRQESALHALEA